MPFRSEKQRRYLWAKHPEIAKEWAHKYPDSNKGLPMYAHDKKEEDKPVSKAAALNALKVVVVNNLNSSVKSIFASACDKNTKKADSKLEHIKVPQSDEPTYAGERKLESILKPETEDEGSIGQERSEKKPETCENMQSNPLLSKLAVVLAPKIQQEIENIRAQQEAREAQRTPQNVNIKKYPVQNFNVPPPMGMTAPPQAPQAPQQPQQAPAQPQNGQMAPVGGGMSPNANPINAFGGLSSTGDINGNAALGTQNQVGGEKLAYGGDQDGLAYGRWVGGGEPIMAKNPNPQLAAQMTRDFAAAVKKHGGKLQFTNERNPYKDEHMMSPEVAIQRILAAKALNDSSAGPMPDYYFLDYPMLPRRKADALLRKDPNAKIYRDFPKGEHPLYDVIKSKYLKHRYPDEFPEQKQAATQKCSCGCGGEKMAGVRDAVLLSLPLATGALGAYLGGRKGHNDWLANETRNDPGGVTSAMNGAFVGGTAGLGLGVIPALIDKYELRDGKINLRQSYLKRWKGHHRLDHLIEDDKTEEKASAQKCSCGCGQKVHECTCPPSCSCRQKGGSCYGLKKQAGGNCPALGKIMSINDNVEPDIEVLDELESEMFDKAADYDINNAPAWLRSIMGAGVFGGAGLRGGALAGGLLGAGHGLLTEPGEYVDAKGEKQKRTRLQKVLHDALSGVGIGGVAGGAIGAAGGAALPFLPTKQSSSPAWQRSAGKNPEGGLNEKGRKSYERETGGNLKAPVTESNPSGERAKRQNSFCSRMCGMKRVNTGAETKSDPDSRINKSLRKWNCKCSSAMEFGEKLGHLLHWA